MGVTSLPWRYCYRKLCYGKFHHVNDSIVYTDIENMTWQTQEYQNAGLSIQRKRDIPGLFNTSLLIRFQTDQNNIYNKTTTKGNFVLAGRAISGHLVRNGVFVQWTLVMETNKVRRGFYPQGYRLGTFCPYTRCCWHVQSYIHIITALEHNCAVKLVLAMATVE